MTSFTFPATPENNRAQSRGLQLALADMHNRELAEQEAMARFHEKHRRFPTAAEWVAAKAAIYAPVEAPKLERAA